MKPKQYITTTLPYVNSKPHIGFAMEIIRADAIARYKKLQGYEVFFNTGTDEHGIKILQKAQEQGIDPQSYVDPLADQFKGLIGLLTFRRIFILSEQRTLLILPQPKNSGNAVMIMVIFTKKIIKQNTALVANYKKQIQN